MNIFVLDLDPKINAQYHVDKHVVKMITEYTQLLSSVFRFQELNIGYNETHVNHPCAKWVRESLDNYIWLKHLNFELHKEWQYRYDHIYNHKAFDMMLTLPDPNLKSIGLTSFVQAMPLELKDPDAVIAYRNYYNISKRHILSWKKRDIPYWII